MGSEMRLKFWGTRGLISTPSTKMTTFGGNTTCIQILHKDNLILVDTGFGASQFGEKLMKRILKDKESLNIHIFYTHFHWDHVQGLPFFHPIYFPSTNLHIYSPETPETMIESLDVLFDGSYSPFSGIDKMPSKINFQQLQGSFCLDGLTIDFTPVHHGDADMAGHLTHAYRFSMTNADGVGESVAIVTDHEAVASPINDRIVEFAKGCDLLVHDGQYTDSEYKRKSNWGHSSMRQALHNSLRINPTRTLITHHDPSHTDDILMRQFQKLRSEKKFANLDFEFAREDHIYEVKESLSDADLLSIKKAG